MKTASVAEVKARFSEFVKASENGPILVTRNGKPVAILSAVTDEEEVERLMMAQSPQLQEILKAAEQRMEAGAGIPSEEFWDQVQSEKEIKKAKGKRRKTG
jgi:prevent-host-death family protein